ncbi:hypothetical protein [Paenibacillus aceti]|nr:hypothetical protein [Paenibacillus aceti]
MIQRNLIECTIDLAQPYTELTATISAVISALPDADTRLSVLRALDDAVTTALLALEGGEEDDE